jgi:chemotaxis protein MotA
VARNLADIARNRPGARRGIGPSPTAGRLDFATILGIVGAFAMMGAALAIGGNIASFIDLQAVLIVVGGTLAVTTASFSLREMASAQRLIFSTVIHRVPESDAVALRVLRLAESSRTNGVLSLETEVARLRAEPVLAKGVQMAVDGTPSEEVERVMRRELHAIQQRHARSAGILRRAAEVAPAMGLIGTLIGLVQMLSHLEDPSTIGPGMAVALLTTFYGAVLATLVFAPLAAKLERNSADEMLINQIYLIACVSIGRQENPRRLEAQVNALLPPTRRVRFFN